MIGIRLPLNFNSPYKATSIIDFWRRWHITLSRFLRDYLYIPLGGSRHGAPRRYVNLMTTMVLGGLWHGASWTFVAWGGLHGLFLLVNHAWRASGIGPIIAAPFPRPLRVSAAVGLTFGLTVVAWVFFRASDFASAWMLLKGMAGLHGGGLEAAGPMRGQINRTVLCLLIVWSCPNSQQILARFRPALEMPAHVALPQRWWMWRPNTAWILFIAFLAAGSVLSLSEISPFIYFNF
jgi:D-alanyl-lipoteichoic acid acyltransferase DltB (MBOAT superfamily)